MKKIMILLILLTFNPFINIFPDTPTKTTIAIFDMDSPLVPGNVINAMNSRLRHALKSSNQFIVLDNEKVRDSIDNEKDRLAEHQDEAYLVEVGELLGADKIIAGDINRDANSLIITIYIFDVVTKQIEKTFSQTYGGVLDGLICQIDILTLEIIQWESDRLLANADTRRLDKTEYEKQKIIIRMSKKTRDGWQAYKGLKKITPYELFQLADFTYEVGAIEKSRMDIKDKKTLAWILNVVGTGFVLYGTANHNPNEIDRTKETLVGVTSIATGVFMLAHAGDRMIHIPLRIAKQAADTYNKKLAGQLTK